MRGRSDGRRRYRCCLQVGRLLGVWPCRDRGLPHDGDAEEPHPFALWLIVAFFSLAVIYLTLHAQFIAVAQVMVYAGAIMMLIIFVIMLIHLEIESTRKGRITGGKVIGAFITMILFLEIGAALFSFPGGAAKASGISATQMGTWRPWGSPSTGNTFSPLRSPRSCFFRHRGGSGLAKRRKE